MAECGLFNIQECLSEFLSDFLLSFLNAPIKPFLSAIKYLLTNPGSFEVFGSIWAVMVYLLSIFYGVFLLFAGLNFIVSGYSAEKRQRAKEWLQNIILMMLSVHSSFLIYTLVANISSGLSSGVMELIDPDFFLFTLDNIVNVFLQIALGMLYLLTLFLTVITFAINYVIISIGVIYFPFGFFFYFIPPLRDIGKLILSKLIFMMFLPFFASLVLLGASELVKIQGVETIKIVLMIGAFALINLLMILMAVLAVFRAVTGLLRTDVAKGILFLKGHFLLSSIAEKQKEPQSEREYWGTPRKDPYERYKK